MFSFFSSYLTILITNYRALLWSGLLSGFVSSMVCLCFLDVFLQVMDAKALFLRLEERGLLDNQTFLSQLLHTIGRIDLLSLLETDGMQPVETDANPMLSEYRWKQKEMYYNWRDNSITVAQSVLFPMCFFLQSLSALSPFYSSALCTRVMLYHVYQDMTEENLDKMKFLLISKLGRRQIEACTVSTHLSTLPHLQLYKNPDMQTPETDWRGTSCITCQVPTPLQETSSGPESIDSNGRSEHELRLWAILWSKYWTYFSQTTHLLNIFLTDKSGVIELCFCFVFWQLIRVGLHCCILTSVIVVALWKPKIFWCGTECISLRNSDLHDIYNTSKQCFEIVARRHLIMQYLLLRITFLLLSMPSSALINIGCVQVLT